jgi:hypothetical protein
MKKIVKITSLLLVVTTLCLFAMACSSYGKLEKAFLNEGFTVSETMQGLAEDLKTELEKKELEITIHGFTKSSTAALVFVFEFKATDDMLEFYKDSDTLQGLLKDIEEEGSAKEFYNELKDKGFAKGNCLIIPIGLDAETVLDLQRDDVDVFGQLGEGTAAGG